MNSNQMSGVANHIERTKEELMKIINDLSIRVFRLENIQSQSKGREDIIFLNDEDFKAFEEALANPKPPTKKLVDAIKRHKKRIKKDKQTELGQGLLKGLKEAIKDKK